MEIGSEDAQRVLCDAVQRPEQRRDARMRRNGPEPAAKAIHRHCPGTVERQRVPQARERACARVVDQVPVQVRPPGGPEIFGLHPSVLLARRIKALRRGNLDLVRGHWLRWQAGPAARPRERAPHQGVRGDHAAVRDLERPNCGCARRQEHALAQLWMATRPGAAPDAQRVSAMQHGAAPYPRPERDEDLASRRDPDLVLDARAHVQAGLGDQPSDLEQGHVGQAQGQGQRPTTLGVDPAPEPVEGQTPESARRAEQAQARSQALRRMDLAEVCEIGTDRAPTARNCACAIRQGHPPLGKRVGTRRQAG